MTGPQPRAHIVWAKARPRRSLRGSVKCRAAAVRRRYGCSSSIAINWTFLTMMRKGTAWLSVALLIFATTGAVAEPRRVLMLHAFGHAYSPWSDMAASFRAELIKKSPEPIDLYEVSLDTARVQDPHDEGLFVEYIRAVFYGRKLDLIVPVGAPAAFLMQRNRQMMFPTTPMLIVGADVRRIPSATRRANDA